MKKKISMVFIILNGLLYPATFNESLKACEKESTAFSFKNFKINEKQVNPEDHSI